MGFAPSWPMRVLVMARSCRRLATADWLKEQREILVFKPTLWGFSFDLKAAFRSAWKWWPR
jgi:hypothetical protein